MKLLNRTLLRGLAVTLAISPVLGAQSQDDLRAKYQQKLSLEFIEHGGWITDYDAARAKAKEEGKPMFVYFSRSYSP